MAGFSRKVGSLVRERGSYRMWVHMKREVASSTHDDAKVPDMDGLPVSPDLSPDAPVVCCYFCG